MVGVPALRWCSAGPSSRMGWPIFSAVSRPISQGPSTNETLSASSAANNVRNVM